MSKQGGISEEEFLAWKDDRVTQVVLAHFHAKREELKDEWARGGMTGPSWDETRIRNVTALGAVSVIVELLEIDFHQLEGVGNETGSVGAKPGE